MTMDSTAFSCLNRLQTFTEKEQEAVYDYESGKRYSYQDLARRSDCLAWFLTETLGLKKGDRVGLCANNSIGYIDVFFAACKTGIILTSYNCLLRVEELQNMIESEDPRVIFYSEKLTKTVNLIRKDERGKKRTYIDLDSILLSDSDVIAYGDILKKGAERPFPPVNCQKEDIQMMIHTGGTTGQPKAAMLSYRSIIRNAESEISLLSLTEKDSAYVFLPFFHTAAWNVVALSLLLVGGRIILTERYDVRKAYKIIQEERPTVAMAVETIYKSLAADSQFDTTDFSCYRFMLSGAAPISYQVLDRYLSRGIKLVNAYGMTEIGPNNLCPPVNQMTITEIREKWRAAGKPMPYNNLRIIKEDGLDAKQGEKGELVWKGDLVFSGYWNNEKETRAIMVDGWVRSGDVGYCDEDGFIYICGRTKNMFICGGENIFPQEIEEVINNHECVEDSCVIGVADERWGEVGRALIKLKQGSHASRKEIIDHIKIELSSIKIPKYITFVDQIPKNQVGKRDLKLIKQEYGNAEE
ncbi:class I adenylate-forming enzyme family protein [Eubacteriaceae bacterium ES3]|nr:class I adenylate-forming enzyme family protein [Eubacteriaceae bacterium ES3]